MLHKLRVAVIILMVGATLPNAPAFVPAAHADEDDDVPQRLLRGLLGVADNNDDDDDDDDDDDAPVVVRRRQAPVQVAAPLPQRAPNEILARGLSDTDLGTLEGQGFAVLDRRDLSDGQTLIRLRKPAALTMEDARQQVRETAERADFNHFYRTEEATCRGVECPARQMIDWPTNIANCGAVPLIGMVDTGLNADHAALARANLRVHRIANEAPQSDQLHGTAVASLLVGASDTRSPGLVPEAPVIAVDAFYRDNADQRADAFALIEALDYLAAQNVRVVNLSLAGPPNTTLEQKVDELNKAGIVIVAAAGNGGPSAKTAYPAGYDQVIAVTAVDRRGQIYRRANRGDYIDLAAPGVDVWTAASISGARTKTGTSYAAPFVTASAALLLQQDASLTPAEVRQRLSANARDLGDAGRDVIYGQGLISAPQGCGDQVR